MYQTLKQDTLTVEAEDVEEGDFIPGLGNAYIFDKAYASEFEITFTAHDANGEEITLTMQSDALITITRA
jgi:hypothetical protein